MSTAGAVRQAFVGVGANLGDRAAALAGALEQLRGMAGVVAVECSSIYETEPVGIVDQPKFLNMVVGIETTLTPEDLLGALQEIESLFGRIRHERWGPRTLDLDLLLFEDATRATPELQLPHPRWSERKFVTVPLRELLERSSFIRPHWAELRAQLRAEKADGKLRVFPSGSGGERS